jgi:ferritin
MISKTMAKEINKQINEELYSSYLYMAMAAYAVSEGFSGVANWLQVQSQEEAMHAAKFSKFLTRVNERVTLDAIAKPPAQWKSVQAVFEDVLKHEQKITSRIHNLVRLAKKEEDAASENMLQWFVAEQVEEEENAAEIIARMKLAGAHGAALLFLDKELGSRKAGG